MNLTQGLHDLVATEPPFVLRPDEVIAAGRRRRHRRVFAVTGSAGLAAVVAVGAVALTSSPATAPTTTRLGAEPTARADTGDTTSEFYRIARAHTPDGWTISNAHFEPHSGWWANVDDGAHGAGRLGMWRSEGGLQQHPCSDSEFVAEAASCTETMLDADTRLIVRTVSRTDPINDVQVVIVHANGYGVNVSDDNAVWPDPPTGAVISTEAEKRALSKGTIGSPEPLYPLDRLVAIAKALDAASS